MRASLKVVLLVVFAAGAGRAAAPPRPAIKPAELLRRAAEAAAKVEEPKDRASALAFIGLAMHKAGDKAGADRLLKQALETASAIEEDTPLNTALSAVVRAEAGRGNAEAAL